MKQTFFILAILALVLRLPGQTNLPIRLALISESDDASAAVDVLTANLSSHTNLQLLERNEIEKVYREQGLSAGNQDYLKLGQVLGADGLLLLETEKDDANQSLNVRLIAIKPGVVLTAEKFPWPLKDPTEWSSVFANHLNVFLPKLAVLAKDAIPISVVNLRSSGQSADVEQELKMLTIQRLSQEPRLFVLERQKMNLLSEEKELKLDDSAFWDGSYLLDGIVDQNGYSKETITINARLTPPKGGAPVLIEASGSRTNLTEAVNQLAAKIDEALKIKPAVKEWSAADEAAQYFAEAKWAFGWGVLSEAQAAVESAWALGKHDEACAVLRINAYLPDVAPSPGTYNISGMTGEGDIAFYDKQETLASKPIAAVFKRHASVVYHAATDVEPDPQAIVRANHLLELYAEYSQSVPESERKPDSTWYSLGLDTLVAASKVLQHFHFVPESQRAVTDQLEGLRSRARAVTADIEQSPAIHDSYFNGSQLTGRNRGNSGGSLGECDDIFSCELVWGCFWQETPEDCLAIYKELMQSPNFLSIQDKLWFRDLINPRVSAWEIEGRSRADSVWKGFVRDLITNSNLLPQLEGWSLKLADAETDADATNDFNALVNIFYSNPDAFTTNPAARAYLDWPMNDLVDNLERESSPTQRGSRVVTAVGDQLRARIKSEFEPKIAPLKALSQNQTVFEEQKKYLQEHKPYNPAEFMQLFLSGFQDYSTNQAQEIQPLLAAYKANLAGTWAQIGTMQIEQVEANVNHILNSSPLVRDQPAFEKQKTFLKENTPFDYEAFEQLFFFCFKDYSKAQAFEIQPLLAAYKSNLVAQAAGLPNNKKGLSMLAVTEVEGVEVSVNRILNPPAPSPQPRVQIQTPKPTSVVKTTVPPASNNPPETVTNILTVGKFLAIPLDGLLEDRIDTNSVTIVAHHFYEGRLLVDFQYGAYVYSFDGKGSWQGTGNVTFPAIAILDPATERWQVITCPETRFEDDNHYYSRSVLWHGELFTSNNSQIKKYDFHSRQWQVLDISGFGNCELFSVNDHLYGANGLMIFEIMDGGKSTHILASTRRRPPASALDKEDLWTPTLFQGPGHTLRVSTKSKIFTWTGKDWLEDFATPPVSFVPMIFPDAVLFLTDDLNLPGRISRLGTESSAVEFCLGQDRRSGFNPGNLHTESMIKPLWQMPPELSLHNLPAATWQTDLYLLVDHSQAQDIVDEQQHLIVGRRMLAKDGYHVELLCFLQDLTAPVKAYLNFDAPDGCPPVTGKDPNSPGVPIEMPPGWMLFTTNSVFFGLERPDTFAPVLTQRPDIGYKIGVWVMPVSQLEPAIASQKQSQLTELAQSQAVAKQTQQAWLAKYDRNHNGILDPNEREALLDNAAFIESQLDVIDANHNGWLDPEELAYFDANGNQTLDTKEQAGIDITLHLLAEKLLKKFDANGDGVLDRLEFSNMMRSHPATSNPNNPHAPGFEISFPISFPDQNHNGRINSAELEPFLKQMIFRDIQPRQAPGLLRPMSPSATANDASQPQLFKAAVESYWRNPDGISDRPQFNNRVPFGARHIPNGMTEGTAP